LETNLQLRNKLTCENTDYRRLFTKV